MKRHVFTLTFACALLFFLGSIITFGKKNFRPALEDILVDCSISQSTEDLCHITSKIYEFRENRGYYPINSPKLDAWSFIITSDNRFDPAFIPGIRLKMNDPRDQLGAYIQYRYISNGAKFKLLIDDPISCKMVKVKYGNLLNRPNDCQSFGVWSGVNASFL